MITGVKAVQDARVGDTVWCAGSSGKIASEVAPLSGYKKVTPFVYAGIFCIEGDDFPLLRTALEKLTLNDSAIQFEPEQSSALGHGFRCGFLGLLHLEIVQERLEREYDLDIIVTAPSVSYELKFMNGEERLISNPAELPAVYEVIREPGGKVEIVTTKKYFGAIFKFLQ